MKKAHLYLIAAGLAVGLAAAPAHAAKPLLDRDNDGYDNSVDCNDKDASINPGALEVCDDGIDNNCNNQIDEGCGVTTCTDGDHDGYSLEGGSCGAVDCNDADPTVNPGAVEECGDGVDNNCNNQVDENCGTASRDLIVVATNDLGMHCACPGSEYFMLLPPFNTIRAQVIERGGRSPVVLDDDTDIRVEYETLQNTDDTLKADPYYSTWIEMMPKYGFGEAVRPDGKIQGLTGSTLNGLMEAKAGQGWWEVVGVPVFPDASNLSTEQEKLMLDVLGPNNPNRNPYLDVAVRVYDQTTNELLTSTTTVAPVAFGGCCNCHLTVAENHGRTNPTPKDSFEVMGELHRDNGSDINIALLDPDSDGTPGPVRCSSCHLDPAMGESQPPGMLSTNPANPGEPMIDPATNQPYPTSQYTFSDVLHRGHVENTAALAMDPNLKDNCYQCHPGNNVNCYRGHHTNESGQSGNMWCTDCHGDLTQRVAEGQLLEPWSDTTLPACEDCHRRTGEGGGDLHMGIFGKYLNSRGHKNDKILCTTCHGAPHALYPSNLAKDNQQVINLQGLSAPIGVCDTCHVGKNSSFGEPQH